MNRTSLCCPRCGALESTSSVRCYRCGTSLTSSANFARAIKNALAQGEILTRGFVAAYVLLFLVSLGLAMRLGGTPLEAILPGAAFSEALVALGALVGPAVYSGEWHRLLTATFLHSGILHLIFNVMALRATGPESERNLGGGRFLVLYLASGVAGNVASLWWRGPHLFQAQVGASGSICGLLGALYVIAALRGGAYGYLVRHIVTRWIIMTVVVGFVLPGVDNAAHISGMITGAALARLMGLKEARA